MSFMPPEFVGSPLDGIDFSWLAVDEDGHVAWLVTFGSAVVPKWVEEHSGDFERIEDELATLPNRGECTADERSPHVEEWLATARSGVFAYDWKVYSGPYKVLAAPHDPLKVEALPRELASLARRTRFAGLCFRDRPVLQLEDVLACERGDVPLPGR